MTPEEEQIYLNKLDIQPGTSTFNLPTETIVSSDKLCIKAFNISNNAPDYLLKYLSPTRIKNVLGSLDKYFAINSLCFNTLSIESRQDPDIILDFCDSMILIDEITNLPETILKDVNFQKKCLVKDPSGYIFLPHQDLTTHDILDIFHNNPAFKSNEAEDDYLTPIFFHVISQSHPEFFNNIDIIRKTIPYIKNNYQAYFLQVNHHLRENIDLVNLFLPHLPNIIYFLSEDIKEKINLNLLPEGIIPNLPHHLKHNQELARKSILASKKKPINKSLISTFPFEIQSEESNIALLLSFQKETELPIIKAIQNIYSLEDYEKFENDFSSFSNLDPLSKLMEFFIFLPKSTKSNLNLLNEIPDLMHPENLTIFWKNLSPDIKNDPIISEQIVQKLNRELSSNFDSFMSYVYQNADSNFYNDSELLFSKIHEIRETKTTIHFKWHLLLNNSDMFNIYKSYLDQNNINQISNLDDFLDNSLISYESLKMYNNLGNQLKPYNSKKGLKF